MPFTDAIAGSTAGLLTDTIFYGLDSYKVQLQSSSSGKVDYKRVFSGILQLPLIGTVPSLFVFFSIYEPIKKYASDIGGDFAGVLAASILAGAPSSFVGVPSDVIKKRMVLGLADSPLAALRQSMAVHGGLRGVMIGNN